LVVVKGNEKKRGISRGGGKGQEKYWNRRKHRRSSRGGKSNGAKVE